MCGIFFSLSKNAQCMPDSAVKNCLRQRGPDAERLHQLEIRAGSPPGEAVYATLFSTVLSLRGQHVVEQPLVNDETDSFLCWNGEAWSISGEHSNYLNLRLPQHHADRIHDNDTEAVFKLLLDASNCDLASQMTCYQPVLEAISLVAGPHAFVYYDSRRKCIYYARDSLGRRSLLRQTNAGGDLMLTSSSCSRPLSTVDQPEAHQLNSSNNSSERWVEVEADGVYIIDLTGRPIQWQMLKILDDGSKIRSWNWHEYNCIFIPYIPKNFRYNESLPCVKLHYGLLNLTSAPSPAPEATKLEHLSHAETRLELTSPAVSKIEALLRSSLDLRLHGLGTPDVGSDDPNNTLCRLAILFSGGLDCTLLARLVHDILPSSMPIDLLNVAFENPRIHSRPKSPFDLCPDRITGRASHAELRHTCPSRLWRFVEINVPYNETLAHRETIISLIHPHNTEMDLSIATALYFASRGVGQVQSLVDSTSTSYTTTARVLLSGLGADELFGGYQRHATAFSRHGFVGQAGALGLLDELQLDVSRLGKRNLGRDDRVLSHWGRETRFPYLDERLVDWAMSAPVWEKTGFRIAEERRNDSQESAVDLEPGKKVLRLLAYRLGLTRVAREPKRAIQFGARTAKMETGRTKGTTLLT